MYPPYLICCNSVCAGRLMKFKATDRFSRFIDIRWRLYDVINIWLSLQNLMMLLIIQKLIKVLIPSPEDFLLVCDQISFFVSVGGYSMFVATPNICYRLIKLPCGCEAHSIFLKFTDLFFFPLSFSVTSDDLVVSWYLCLICSFFNSSVMN